ncbi:MarR family transcriptional regulator [Streptomyces olivaceus]|uniref:MarR family transcriptional regulator n=1 Tax=Streptomyces olivaceus TaxID=47716 RepID=A0ABS7WDX1_STROV|nr:MarR family transcriptional regulator [Streptomyces olivaceus]MBZ6100036.1 MarR family transcriptional regulator [Streptomyces olivaceus]MBZ6113965.1 MarR family transcriptional regulator [Streptomyces olivaceus]MBZ6121010.1 MarR family transcriptional regulator [Streptomyces olivaceus]MBZ6127758.1 MarR family transcriptional regulator [Streptomyces olivaceus]
MEVNIASVEGILAVVAETSTPAGLPAPDRIASVQAAWRRERPDLDVAPQAVIGRLHRLAALLTEELCVVYRRHGLGEGDFDVLAALRRAGDPFERAPGELAAHTMVTTGAMTKRIDRLERAGLVTRRRATGDGRGRVVALTPAGRELIDRAFTEHMRNEHRLMSALSRDEASALEALLTAWLARVEHGGGPGDGA